MTTKQSIYLSRILRHGPTPQHPVKIRSDGFTDVPTLLSHRKLSGLTLEGLRALVNDDKKGRFSLREEDGGWVIRANQGHSINVEDLELSPILDSGDIPVVIHGSQASKWHLIRETGLSRMNRTHIHFATGMPGESGVISGMRTHCSLIIYVDAAKAMKDGIEFFKSSNGVILTSGVGGTLDSKYFQKVIMNGKNVDL